MTVFDLHADTPLVLAKHADRNPAVALIGHGFEAYTQVAEWAEPDIDAAAESLKLVFTNAVLVQSKAASASAFVDNYCSPSSFKVVTKLSATEEEPRLANRLPPA